ncbi:MAG: glycoside hydrolase family 30 protein [Bacteroidales bacterium]|nr:glycoside hydrolase family 30 protein [Bacteroidales bacterium]
MKRLIYFVAGLTLAACSHPPVQEKAQPAAFSLSQGRQAAVYVTAKDSPLRLTKMENTAFNDFGQPLETQICVFVDPEKTFQEMLGIGGAITDASAETFFKLPAEIQQKVIEAYFSPEKGIGYNLIRTNIHSCDFSSGSYTYVNEGDSELNSFDIGHDKQFKLPLIKKAVEVIGKDKVTFYASPWSPPAWMKTNNNMLQGGSLKPEFYDSWANYYVKFIKAYEAEGIPVWGITIQNEPMAKQTWESCIYTAEEEADFLKNHLGPVMHKSGLADKKIVMWDHNRDLIYQRATTYFADPAVRNYAWGLGFHWYEDWSGGVPVFENVRRVQEAFPEKNLLFTEGCAESFNPTRYEAWELGEEYGRSMIHDFNNGAVGWTDWNILLDERGGPNHVGNFCFAPLHGNTQTGELTFTNSYYYIGHFSKFIQKGAKRVIASPSRSQLISTAFLNPDGSLVVVVMNESEIPTDFFLWINGKAAPAQSPPHSMMTFVL